MFVFGVILGTALGLLSIVAFRSSIPAPSSYYYPRIILGEIVSGAILAILIGVAMGCYAGIAHRTIRKPHFFKFALLIVATIVSLVVVQQPFHIVTLSELGIPLGDLISWAFRYPLDGLILFGTIAKHMVIGLTSIYVAGKYLREASERFLESTGQQADP